MKRSEARWAEVRVGLFVAMIIALLFGAAIYVGMTGSPMQDFERFQVRATQGVSGFARGSPVEMGGVVVGEVTAVHAPSVEERSTVLDVKIGQHAFHQLGPESRAELLARSLVGQRYLSLRPRPEGTPPLGPGGWIDAVPATDLEALVRAAHEAIHDARRTMAALAATADAISDIVGGLHAGKGTLGRLLREDDLHQDLSRAAARLADVSRDLSRGKGALGKLIQDPDTARQVEATLSNLAESSGALERLIEDIRRNPQRYVQVKVF